MFKNALKIILVLCLLIVGFAAQAEAQTTTSRENQTTVSPEKQALIQELLNVTNAKKNAEDISNLAIAQVEAVTPNLLADALSKRAGLQGDELRQKTNEHLAQVLKRFKQLYPQKINYTQVVNQVTYPLYARFFTEEELKDLVNFYKSSTGKKTIAVIPQLAAESVQQSNELLLPKTLELMQQVVNEDVRQSRYAAK